MFKSIYRNIKKSAELVELLGKILAFILIFFGTTVSAFWARTSKELNDMGPFIWMIVTISTALILTLIIYVINLSFKIRAQANLATVEANHIAILSTPRSRINPLEEVFSDLIIDIPDLYLPLLQLHENKVFTRCKIVGPGAIAIMGGTIAKNKFIHCGDFIVLPDNSLLTGILVFKNCTFQNCEIIQVTVTGSSKIIEDLKKSSMH